MELGHVLPDYSLSCKEFGLFCLISPYAQRHYEYYKYNKSKTHQYIAYAEYIPIIGTVISVVEVAFVKINNFFAFSGLQYDTPVVDDEIEDRVQRAVNRSIPDFNDLKLETQYDQLVEKIDEFSLTDRMSDWNDKQYIKTHHKLMKLLWRFTQLADKIVDNAAGEQLEEGEDIKTRRAKIYANQEGTPRMYNAFFMLPKAYEQARAFTCVAHRNAKGKIIATTSLYNKNFVKWTYRSRIFYQESRQMFWRTLFNGFCKRMHEKYDYQAFLINRGTILDTRFAANTKEDHGVWFTADKPSG